MFGPDARFANTPRDFAAELGRALTSSDPVRTAAGRKPAVRHTWAEAAERHLAFYRSVTP